MRARTVAEALVWVCGATLCAAAAWATWTADAPTVDAPATPDPLPRPASPAEEAAARELASGVLAELRAAAARAGTAPALGELEGLAQDGLPYLPSGLPDNPLAPGVAGVVDGCQGAPAAPPGGVDWRYCATPLLFEPGHSRGSAQRGKP